MRRRQFLANATPTHPSAPGTSLSSAPQSKTVSPQPGPTSPPAKPLISSTKPAAPSSPPEPEGPLAALRSFLQPPPRRSPAAAANQPLRSKLFGGAAADKPSLFPQPDGAHGLLGDRTSRSASGTGSELGEPGGIWYGKRRKSNTWDLRSWKKFTLDLYIRLVERPRDSRLRLKQTVALLPFAKLKPTVDISADPRWEAPVRMRLDVKLLGFLQFRVAPDGGTVLRVRARAPLEDPRFGIDVIYQRDMRRAEDSVRVTFRALDAAFLKGPPKFGAGCKIPIHFSKGVKSTIRVKKYLLDRTHQAPRKRGRPSSAAASQQRNWFDFSSLPEAPPRAPRRGHSHRSRDSDLPRFGVYGPAGVDVKLRLWSFGEEVQDASPRSPEGDVK